MPIGSPPSRSSTAHSPNPNRSYIATGPSAMYLRPSSSERTPRSPMLRTNDGSLRSATMNAASAAVNSRMRSRAVSIVMTRGHWRPARRASLRPAAVRIGHAEALGGLSFEVHFDQDGRLVADDVAVVAGFDRDHLRRDEFHRRAVTVVDVDAAARDEPDVRVHAQLGPHLRLHVRGPAEPRLVDHPLDAAAA